MLTQICKHLIKTVLIAMTSIHLILVDPPETPRCLCASPLLPVGGLQLLRGVLADEDGGGFPSTESLFSTL